MRIAMTVGMVNAAAAAAANGACFGVLWSCKSKSGIVVGPWTISVLGLVETALLCFHVGRSGACVAAGCAHVSRGLDTKGSGKGSLLAFGTAWLAIPVKDAEFLCFGLNEGLIDWAIIECGCVDGEHCGLDGGDASSTGALTVAF